MANSIMKPTKFRLSRLDLPPGEHKLAVRAHRTEESTAPTASAESKIHYTVYSSAPLVSSDNYIITDVNGNQLLIKEKI